MKVFRTFALVASLAVPAVLWAPAAMAADAQPDVTPAGTQLYTWSDPYAGGFVGYSFSNFDGIGGADVKGEGAVGGLYGGYRVQNGQLVYGVEADIGASDLSGGGFSVATGLPISTDSTAFGSLRAQIGVAYDPILLFATGGVALSNKELTLGNVSDDQTHVGYTVGAGIDAKVADGVTSRLEYRYSNYNTQTYDLGNTSVSSGFDEHSVRAGLALKF